MAHKPTNAQLRKINKMVFDSFSENTKFARKAADTVNEFTRDKMHRLRHIPNKYFLSGDTATLEILAKEIGQHGYINLDKDGEPCCLSGKPPVLTSKG